MYICVYIRIFYYLLVLTVYPLESTYIQNQNPFFFGGGGDLPYGMEILPQNESATNALTEDSVLKTSQASRAETFLELHKPHVPGLLWDSISFKCRDFHGTLQASRARTFMELYKLHVQGLL